MGRPLIQYRHKVCVICEGLEDAEYFKRLMQLNVWNNDIYEFIPINAESASNIPARYQNAYSNDSYEIILVFCDTDKAPYREYSKVKQKINDFHAKQDISDKIIIYANPCTMQIILSHFGDVNLKNQGKKTNAKTIEELTGITNYDAHEDQVAELCAKIFRRSYPKMKARVADMNQNDTTSGSTNFIIFLERFESADPDWIKEIDDSIKQS